MCVYIYIYMYTHIIATYVYIYIYIHTIIYTIMFRGRGRRGGARGPCHGRPAGPYGRFPKFHRVFSGRDPGTLKSDIVSKKTSTIILFGFETLKLKIRRFKLLIMETDRKRVDLNG